MICEKRICFRRKRSPSCASLHLSHAHLNLFLRGPCHSLRREPFSPHGFLWGEKVAKPDEGGVSHVRHSRAFERSRTSVGKSRVSRKAPPSSAFGTFSPRKKPRWEKGSRRREWRGFQDLTLLTSLQTSPPSSRRARTALPRHHGKETRATDAHSRGRLARGARSCAMPRARV